MTARPRGDWRPRVVRDIPDGLILFDGVCVLCSRWVGFVLARDAAERWRFVSIQSPYGRRLASTLGIDPETPETNAAVIGGVAYFKLDSAIAVVGSWPAWSWVLATRLLPRRWRDWAYDRIARNRYRVFGRMDACHLPTPALAKRFIVAEP